MHGPATGKGEKEGGSTWRGVKSVSVRFPLGLTRGPIPPFWPSSLFPSLVLGKWEGKSEERAAKGDEGRLEETLAMSQTSGEIKSVHI